MPEADARTDKNFFLDIPVPDQGFFLKGSASYDWGMKNRLSRIFRPDIGPHRHVGHRPRLLPRPDDRPGAR